MDTVTYPDPRVVQFVGQHFVPVQIKVKQEPRLAQEYQVSWTPNLVVADADGTVHYREEGYLPPEDLIACLSLGLGKYQLHYKQLAEAAGHFEEVARRHPGTEAGAEALYWLGVARYKETHDKHQLRPAWERLAKEYPKSQWAQRSQIP
jgi:tetratricopeptide (TPR) repeat protein